MSTSQEHVNSSNLKQSSIGLGCDNQSSSRCATKASDTRSTTSATSRKNVLSHILLLTIVSQLVCQAIIKHTNCFVFTDSFRTKSVTLTASRHELDQNDRNHANEATHFQLDNQLQPIAAEQQQDSPNKPLASGDARAAISLRQVLIPLLTAGHLSRTRNNKERYAKEPLAVQNDYHHFDLVQEDDRYQLDKSPNNRGPVSALRFLHAKRRPPQRANLLDADLGFGQRRRQDTGPTALIARTNTSASWPGNNDDLAHAPQVQRSRVGRDSFARGDRLAGARWSQPDPRKSYSLPVSLVRVVSSRPRHGTRRVAAPAASRRASLGSRQLQVLSSNELSGNEPTSLEIDGVTTEPTAAILSSTLSSLSTASSSELPTSELPSSALFEQADTYDNDTVADLDQLNEQVFGSSTDRQPTKSSKSQYNNNGNGQQLPQLVFGGRYQAKKQPAPPMVTVIRYLPVSLSIPADQVAAVAVVAADNKPQGAKTQLAKTMGGLVSGQSYADLSSASNNNLPTTGPASLLLDQLYRYRYRPQQQDQHFALAPIKQQSIVAAPKYHIIDTLLPGLDDPVGVATQAKQAVLAVDKHNQLGDISSDHSQLHPSSLNFQIPQPAGSGAIGLDSPKGGPVAMLLASPGLAANGQHQGQTLTRLAYLPMGPPTQLALPMGHAAGKAISAYASRLISMLRPSALLSTIGASSGPPPPGAVGPSHVTSGGYSGAYFANQQQTRNHPLQHIYLLAPAETMVPPTAAPTGQSVLMKHANKPASRQLYQQVTPQLASGAIVQQKQSDDVLMNQASKVHSTKSREQQSSNQQQQKQNSAEVAWPFAPQMNGLVCIQGVIGSKSGAKTTGRPEVANGPTQLQQQQMGQEAEDDSGSFDYERPKGNSAFGLSKMPQPSGTKTSKSPPPPPAKGSPMKRERYRDSPVRLAQKMSGKSSSGQQDQSAHGSSATLYDDASYQEPMIAQHKLMRSSSDETNSIVDASMELAKQQQQQRARAQPKEASVRQEFETRRSIIPFTIRDKIDVPANGARSNVRNQQQQQYQHFSPPSSTTGAPSQTNGPVQYDEPSESESPIGASLSRNTSDERRSRTSFSATSPFSSTRQQQPQHQLRGGGGGGGQQHNLVAASRGHEIDCKKETTGFTNDNPRDYSLPVLMASSAPAHNNFGVEHRGANQRRQTQTGTGGATSYSRFAPAVGGAMGPHSSSLVVSSHELMGLSSSSSGVSTTTTTAANLLTGATNPMVSTMGPPPQSVSSPEREAVADTSKSSLNGDNLGQLIKSISLSRESTNDDELDDRGRPRTLASKRISGRSQAANNSRNTTDALAAVGGGGGGDRAATVELVVNSTSREQRTTGEHLIAQNITASPLNLQQHHQHQQQTDSASGSSRQRHQLDRELADSEPEAAHSTNTFSHDRTLSAAGPSGGTGGGGGLNSAGPYGQFGKISESLQTNPLDLIDLQNSRSSFELPSQLESLSMFYSDPKAVSKSVDANLSRVETLNQAETSDDGRRQEQPVSVVNKDKQEEEGSAAAAALTNERGSPASTSTSHASGKSSPFKAADE